MASKDPNIRLFCDNCGTLINITARGEIRCPLCRSEYDASLLDRYERRVDLIAPEEEQLQMNTEGSVRTVIDERCPECNHEGLYFSTAQLRSADEGQTVFYECPKCGHRYQQNA